MKPKVVPGNQKIPEQHIWKLHTTAKKKPYQALHIYLGKQTLRPALCAR